MMKNWEVKHGLWFSFVVAIQNGTQRFNSNRSQSASTNSIVVILRVPCGTHHDAVCGVEISPR